MTQSTQELGIVTLTLADIQAKDATINSLETQVANARMEARLAKELADVKIAALKQEEKSITVYKDDSWSRPKIVGTTNLDVVIADIRVDMDKTYATRISKLESQIEAKDKAISSLEDKLSTTKVDYSNELTILRKENDMIRRENTLTLEQEKLALAEQHAKKLASFKEQKADLEKELVDVREELEKVREDKTNEQLAKTIREEMNKLRTENEVLRSKNPIGLVFLTILNRIKGTTANSDKLHNAIRRRYGWFF